jgi:hypothetical protein
VTLAVHGGTVRLPAWHGPSPYPAPELPPSASHDSGESAEGVTWTVERDVLARTTRCAVAHGSTYDIPHGGSAAERYRGSVSVDQRTFAQRAQAEAEYALRWPDASVSTRAELDLLADEDAYRVSITLEARDGDEIVARRAWAEDIPRRLA